MGASQTEASRALPKTCTGRVGRLREPLEHYTLWSWDQYLKKFDRYTRLQAQEWYAAGRRPRAAIKCCDVSKARMRRLRGIFEREARSRGQKNGSAHC